MAGSKRKEHHSPESSSYGPWTVVQRGGRRGAKNPRGKIGMSGPNSVNAAETNQAAKKQNSTAQSKQPDKERELGGSKKVITNVNGTLSLRSRQMRISRRLLLRQPSRTQT